MFLKETDNRFGLRIDFMAYLVCNSSLASTR